MRHCYALVMLAALAVLSLAPADAGAQLAQLYAVDPSQSTVRYNTGPSGENPGTQSLCSKAGKDLASGQAIRN